MGLSVIIPVFNNAQQAKLCIDAVLASTEVPFEIIVIDDGSYEPFTSVAITVIRQEQAGAGAARNTGVANARYDKLVFLDSDVIIPPNALATIDRHLENADYVTLRYSKAPANTRWIHRYKAIADHHLLYADIFPEDVRKRPIRGAVLSGGIEGWRRDVFEVVGPFSELEQRAGIEREHLIRKLSPQQMLGDGTVPTSHHFPGFVTLVRNYVFRTYHTMQLRGYAQPYLSKNALRTALGAFTVLSGLLSFVWVWSLIPCALSGLWYYRLNRFLFASARTHGRLFTAYTVALNLFFSSLISAAGFTGLVKRWMS